MIVCDNSKVYILIYKFIKQKKNIIKKIDDAKILKNVRECLFHFEFLSAWSPMIMPIELLFA